MNYYHRSAALAGAGLTPEARRLLSSHSAAALFSLLVALLLAVGSAQAAIINANSGLLGDVKVAVATAVDGDTVVIPSGTAEWTSTLAISKAITLQGNGMGNTIIHDGVPAGSSMITWTLVANKTSRMTGIEFQAGSRTGSNYMPLVIINGLSTDGRRVRVDHCKFNEINGLLFLFNTALGVVDHNVIIGPTSGQPAFIGYVKGSVWGSPSGNNYFGDGAWAESDNFGTDKFTFFESNTITNNYAASALTMLDCQAGGRYVFRYNSVQGGSMETHGLEAERERSGRAFEIYNNSFTSNNIRQTPVYMRGGVGLVYNNTITGWTTSASFALLNNRTYNELAMPFGGSDGRNPWDVNDPANPFVTGTCSSSSALTLTDSSKSWATNQWAGYIIRHVSGVVISSMTRSGSTVTVNAISHGFVTGDFVSIWGANEIGGYNGLHQVTVVSANQFTFPTNFTPTSPATGTIRCYQGNHFSEIVSNTATDLTFKDSAQPISTPGALRFAVGDTYEINKVIHSMDMIGRGGGAINLAGVYSPSIVPGWNDQVTSAWYEWNNTREGGVGVHFSPNSGTLLQGVHYFNNTQKPGYTSYTFPHPLTGGNTQPSPPSNLRISGP